MWNEFISLFANIITYFSGIFGHNIGIAILVSTLLIRFALLPLSVKIASGTFRRQKQLEALQPEIDIIKTQYKDKPEQISMKTLALYKERGISPVDGKSLLGGFLQAPIFIAMFSAIRKIIGTGDSFLWIHNIAGPDIILTLIAAGLTGIATLTGPDFSAQSKNIMMWLPVFLTLLFLWKLSAGIGIYWIGSNLVSVVQSFLLRRKVQAIHNNL
jgi:YidC/Oxa1 family membrane protein insertase